MSSPTIEPPDGARGPIPAQPTAAEQAAESTAAESTAAEPPAPPIDTEQPAATVTDQPAATVTERPAGADDERPAAIDDERPAESEGDERPAESEGVERPAAADAAERSAVPVQQAAAVHQPNGATQVTSLPPGLQKSPGQPWQPPHSSAPPPLRPPHPGAPQTARQPQLGPAAPGQPKGPVGVLIPPPPPPIHQQQLGPNPALISPVRLGPPDPSPMQRRWPLRSTAAGPDVLIGALIAAVVAAAALPLDRPGLGWPIAGLGLVGALLVVLLRMDPKQRGTSALEATCWSVATVALLSVGVFRAAGWLFLLCVLAAFGSVALAVGAGRRVPAVFMALLNLPLAGLRSLPWVAKGLARARAKESGGSAMRVLASIGLGLLLLIVFGALFASADAAFDRIVEAILPDLSLATPFRWLFVGAVFAFLTFGGAFLLHSPSTFGDGTPRPRRSVRWYEWVVPVGAVLVVFGIFVGVQVAVLFGDRDYVMRTARLTFADYARKGFWQLLVITLLTLVVIAVTVRKAARETPRERLLLRVMLGLLSAGALVVVISALWRMDVYEQAYGFSRLRILVSAFELWLGGLIVLIMVAGVVRVTRWLPRTAVALWVITLLGLAVLNPDRFIAEQNVARLAQNNTDIWYLSTLSADAAPALDKLPPGARECALSEISRDVRDADDWRGWNLGRAQARKIVPEVVRAQNYPCYRRY